MANDIIGRSIIELKQYGFADLVVLADGLDILDPRRVTNAQSSSEDSLFIYDHRRLTSLNCHIVYTAPLYLTLTSESATIAHYYRSLPSMVSQACLRSQPPRRDVDIDAVEKFGNVLTRRLDVHNIGPGSVFSSEKVRHSLVLLSGGNLGLLFSLMSQLITLHDPPFTIDDLKEVEIGYAHHYNAFLVAEYKSIIEDIKRDGQFLRSTNNREIFFQMLLARVIFQYRSDVLWYDVNPLVWS